MKKYLLSLVWVLVTMPVWAQMNNDESVRTTPQGKEYRPNEVIVKFKSDGDVQIKAPRRARFATSQVSAVDQLFATLGVDSVEELMPMTGNKPMPRKIRTFAGKDIEPKNLGKLYRLTLNSNASNNVENAIEQLKQLEDVEFAEPNYIVYAQAVANNDSATYCQEPLYSQQWGLEAIKLPAIWNKPKVKTKRPVIAILDTGVDTEHPDLAANIWTNTVEANGVAKQDDDQNGYKDDIHGWDFINNTGTIKDFNGHGTHCAGIAAAVGDNGIGITGANPDALIMPVTVMQSDGTGDVATIIKGIDYASANGADVISMSFGGYSYSLAEEQALGRAYANCVLIAAAGNDGLCINTHDCEINKKNRFVNMPLFPAALSFVLGVEASANAMGELAAFSNFDHDGPICSAFGEDKLYNYELRAPGVGIMSTFPGGRYKSLNGTSMACPMVAGAISRLMQTKEILSQEILFGDMIHTRKNMSGNIEMLTAYNISDKDRKPELSLVSTILNDSVGGDGDGDADAGETIDIYPTFRNGWGMAENVRFWIKVGAYNQGSWMWDDTAMVKTLQDTAYVGVPISSYAKVKSHDPFRILIDKNCADGKKVNLTVFATCDNSQIIEQTFSIKITNSVEIGGMLTEDMTLYPNVHYVVTKNLAVPSGVTLTILPGTTVKFKDNTEIKGYPLTTSIQVDQNNDVFNIIDTLTAGRIIAKGTKDSLITFTAADGAQGIYSFSFTNSIPYDRSWDNHVQEMIYLPEDIQKEEVRKVLQYAQELVQLEYVKIDHMRLPTTTKLTGMIFNNCIFQYCTIADFGTGVFNNCNFYYNQFGPIFGGTASTWCRGINIAQCTTIKNEIYKMPSFVKNCNMFPLMYTNTPMIFSYKSSNISTMTSPEIYYGSAKESILRQYVYDMESNYGFAYYDLSNMLLRPASDAHGIVWKILVDGIDAQDEFDMLPPIGVGTHKCEVYFNRPMDVSVTPFVSYGVRTPYTQHAVSENASWSADSTVYTAYFTIDGKTVSDGLNTFYVDGAKDMDHFEIPIENYRFKMEIAAAGSMSTGLMATPGIGKVALNWETDEEDFADLLGYNIYRWSEEDTIWNSKKTEYRFDTIQVNSTTIDSEDTAFVDYNVVPGKLYYYVIKQITTSLTSYALSNPVAVRPYTSIKGDANGSMAVDVADVMTEVNYIAHQNPQPFIFEAADVNSDKTINIFDVVGTVNLILHPSQQSQSVDEGTAYYYIKNGILYVETDVVLGGVQFTFAGDSAETSIVPLDALNDFERVGLWQDNSSYMFLAYSMTNKTIGVGETALLQIGDAEVTSIALSDTKGHNVRTIGQVSTALDGTIFIPGDKKIIENGHMYILHEGKKYSAIGELIQ